ncbi:MAG: metallophosphoesterase family protein [Bacteroidales bacterium]|nr:metallophosphoesterase family protein [Bacteroidales bacterium]
MLRVGLLSDTHGFWDEGLNSFFADCDEIWHAGDIGNLELADAIAQFKPLRAVHGNIDDSRVRLCYPHHLHFNVEGVNVLITHIGGVPGKYDIQAKPLIERLPVDLFICGHSHILRVKFDKKRNFLYVNPGAAGNSGFHTVKTAVRFVIEGGNIRDMEVWEKARKGH